MAKKTNKLSRLFGSRPIVYITIIIATILLLLLGIFLYRKLLSTQFELESCKSSCSSFSS